jgi:hypothetical protein
MRAGRSTCAARESEVQLFQKLTKQVQLTANMQTCTKYQTASDLQIDGSKKCNKCGHRDRYTALYPDNVRFAQSDSWRVVVCLCLF